MSKNKKKNKATKPAKKAPAKVAKKAKAKAAKQAKKKTLTLSKAAKPAKSAKIISAKKAQGKPTPAPIKGKVGKLALVETLVVEVKSDVILTNADGKQYCKVHDCDEAAVIDGHCRLHYIMYWKRNKNKTKILEGSKLDKYIEELTQRYPDKYLEMLKKDLSSEKDFNGIIAEMDADDNEDSESEEDDNRFIEEVRGGVPSTSDDDDGGF